MTKISLLSLLLQGIPESICFVLLLYALLKTRFRWGRVIPAGITGAAIIYLVRLLPLPLGVHTVVMIIFLYFALKILTKQKALKIFQAIFVGYFILSAAEIVFNELILWLFQKSLENIASDSLLWILMGLPQVLLLLLLALWLDRRNRLREAPGPDPAGEATFPGPPGGALNRRGERLSSISEEPALEHITTIHLLCFLICIITLICYHGNRAAFLWPWGASVYLSLVLPFVYWAITSFMYNHFFQNDALKQRMNLIYVLLTLGIVFLTVYSTGNNDSPVKLLFLIPIIVSGTVLGRLSSLVIAAAVGSYYLCMSLGGSREQVGPLAANLVFMLVMLLASWLVGEFTEIQKRIRRDLVSVNENLEQMVDERTVTLTAQQRIYRAMLGALEEAAAATENHYTEIRSQAGPDTSFRSIDYEEAVVGRILQVACEITGAVCSVYLKHGDAKGRLRLVSLYGRSEAYTARAREKLQSLKTGEGGLPGRAEILKSPLYLPVLTNFTWLQVDPGDRSAYITPILYGEKLFGLIALISDRTDGFSAEQRGLTNTLLSCFSNAIENARLFAEIRNAFEKLNALQQQLHQAQKMEAIGQLAGGMAHELNNQLTVIQACVDLRLYRNSVDEDQRSSYLRIRQAAERSANLARQLLLFGRKHPQFKAPLNLNQAIEECVKMLDRMIGEDIDFDLELQQYLWHVNADAANIDQVLVNLLINARDAMPNGGRIAIRTRNVEAGEFAPPGQSTAGSLVYISVSDTGTGMDEETRAHIFEPFFTTKERGKGTGLGLSVVYGIIQDHDGFLNVKSTVKEGSTFEIYLPGLHTCGELRGEEATPQQQEFRGNGESILLVEDDPEVMGLTREILAENNYIVTACGSYNDALLCFIQGDRPFDLLLSDIILPDGRGTELASQLRDLRPSLPVLLCSGYADDRTDLESLQLEGMEFVSKPFDTRDLLRRIQELLGKRSRAC